MASLYEKDFYGWCVEQGQVLSYKNWEKLDWENVREEIESMGKREKRILTSCFKVIFEHLLKWIYQPARRGRSWRDSIERERDKYWEIIKYNPSLKNEVTFSECVEDAYRLGRKEASRQTKIPLIAFPKELPFSVEEALKEGWFPS